MQNISIEPLKIFMHYKVIAGYMLHVKSYEIREVSGINEEEFRSSMLRCYAFVAELINSTSL